jgi:hypothetical protein
MTATLTKAKTPKTSGTPLNLENQVAEARNQIFQFAVAAAEGKPVDAEDLRNARVDSGLSIAELSKIVETVKVRLAAAKMMNDVDNATSEIQAMEAEVKSLAEQLVELHKKHDAEITALTDRQTILHQKTIDLHLKKNSDLQTGRQKLVDSADPKLRNELRYLGNESSQMAVQLRQLESRCKSNPACETEEEMKRDKLRRDSARQRAAVVRRDLENIHKRQKEINSQILDPLLGITIESILKKQKR